MFFLFHFLLNRIMFFFLNLMTKYNDKLGTVQYGLHNFSKSLNQKLLNVRISLWYVLESVIYMVHNI